MKRFWSWLKRHTILYHLTVIALIFIGVAIVSFVAMAFGTRHSARRTVPDFVGLQLNDAEYFAERRDLNIIVNDSLHVSAYPGGVVLDQLPKGGVVVKPGRKIYVTINSSRQRMVAVPYVAGRSLRQAKNMLETAGLTIDHLEYAEDIATNYVLAEFIDGAEILEDSEVQAEMGSGVVLRVGVAPNDTSTAVPQVVGRSLFEAKSKLWESGLNIGEVIFEEGMPALDRNRAKVYQQSILPSEAVSYGKRVSLHLTLDAEKVESAVAECERRIEEALKAKMEADSIAKAEQRLLDSVANAEKKSAPQSEDNFFF
ncbi:MAG: PASTA domain-containing protein [Alistipes sp.]|nr:PASTA domain-containing protein [Alistipes sp.]